MTAQTKYSVIIPVKNSEKFIIDAIKSLVNQTAIPDSILVVDNNSTDNTVQRIKQHGYAVKMLYETKSGAAVARNKGFDFVKTPLVAFLDSDDICHPERLEKSLKILEADAEAAMVFCAIEYMDEDGMPSGTRVKCSEYRAGDFFGQLLIRNRIATTSCVVVRTGILKSLGGFDENLSHNEEYDLWLRIAKRHKIAYLDQALLYYRLHGENISRNKPGQQENERKALRKHDLDTIRTAIRNLYQDPLETDLAYARILYRRGNRKACKDLVFKLAASGRRHYQIQFYLGNFHLLDGQLTRAARAYHDCLKMQSDFLPALNNLGIAQWGQGDAESARNQFYAAIEKNGVYHDPRSNLEKMDQNEDYQNFDATWAPLRSVLKPST